MFDGALKNAQWEDDGMSNSAALGGFGISNTAGGGSGMRNAAPEEFDMSYAAAPGGFDKRKPAGRRN